MKIHFKTIFKFLHQRSINILKSKILTQAHVVLKMFLSDCLTSGSRAWKTNILFFSWDYLVMTHLKTLYKKIKYKSYLC